MIGVDEVGRGCLAGPLLVVASQQTAALPYGLKDSKLMTKPQRLKMFDLLSICCNFGEGWVQPTEIDRYGLAQAMRLGVARALRQLSVQTTDRVILDGPINYLPKKFTNFECLINADNLLPIVSAASVYAKVRRDESMVQIAQKHPKYGFEKHVGYGTAGHFAVLRRFGPLTGIHRYSFRGVVL